MGRRIIKLSTAYSTKNVLKHWLAYHKKELLVGGMISEDSSAQAALSDLLTPPHYKSGWTHAWVLHCTAGCAVVSPNKLVESTSSLKGEL